MKDHKPSVMNSGILHWSLCASKLILSSIGSDNALPQKRQPFFSLTKANVPLITWAPIRQCRVNYFHKNISKLNIVLETLIENSRQKWRLGGSPYPFWSYVTRGRYWFGKWLVTFWMSMYFRNRSSSSLAYSSRNVVKMSWSGYIPHP